MAIALGGAEDIAINAMRVHADESVFPSFHIASHQRQMHIAGGRGGT